MAISGYEKWKVNKPGVFCFCHPTCAEGDYRNDPRLSVYALFHPSFRLSGREILSPQLLLHLSLGSLEICRVSSSDMKMCI